MSSTNKTTNYNLSQFVGTDVPSYLGDYNSDMSKIDKAIGDVANSQGSVEQSVLGLTAEMQGLSTQVDGVATSVQQLQTSVAQIDSGYKQADTALSQRITANANNIQTNTTAIDGINTAIGTEDISEIGDGTIKGAISSLESKIICISVTNVTTDDYGFFDITSALKVYKDKGYKILNVYGENKTSSAPEDILSINFSVAPNSQIDSFGYLVKTNGSTITQLKNATNVTLVVYMIK